jgi:predicted GNAT superfamily acetyltransferase
MMLRLLKHKIVIICGHFGTGKTNIAVNLAISGAKAGMKMLIADLDIVNPYFRTADNAEYLKVLGVTTLIPPYANTNVDIPSLPPAMHTIFSDDNYAIIDVGGNAEGGVVLGVFKEDFEKAGYDMYYVFNACRPENLDAQTSLSSLKSIERSSGLKFTGIINNTNLGVETTRDLVEWSIPKAVDFSNLAGIKLVMTTAFEQSASGDTVAIQDITKKIF